MGRDATQRWTTGVLVGGCVLALVLIDLLPSGPPRGTSRTERTSDDHRPASTGGVVGSPRGRDDDRTAAGSRHEGVFTLRTGQGFSFATARVGAATDGDLRVVELENASAAGAAPVRVVLASPAGLASTNGIRHSRSDASDASAVFARIHGVRPWEVAWKPRRSVASADASGDVLLVRVRSGGFAKVRLERLDVGADPAEPFRATFRYHHAPSGATFGEPPATTRAVEGFVFDETGDWSVRRRWEGEGDVPSVDDTQEVLVASRSSARRYSFTDATRDDPGRVVRGDWELAFGRAGVSVRIQNDDRSTISWNGRLTWSAAARLEALPETLRPSIRPRLGGVYHVRTHDGDSRSDTLLRVTGLVDRERIAFEWMRLEGGRFTTSSMFGADAATCALLEQRLRRLARTGLQFASGSLGSEPRKRAFTSLSRGGSAFECAPGTRLGALVDRLARSGIDASIHPSLAPRTRELALSVDADGMSTADLLDAATRQHGLGWTIDEDGGVVVGDASALR